MDIDVKQRLTGAIVLVVLIVLVVPSLLTGPSSSSSSPSAESTSVSTEPPLRAYTAQLDGSGTLPGVPPEGESAAPPQPLPADVASAPPAEEEAESDAVAATAEPASPAAVSTPAEPAPRKAEPVAKPAPAAKPASSAKPPPAPKPAAPAPSESASRPAASGWAVQVGSFSSRANADRLTRQLQGKGFKAFVASGQSGGKPVFRVRVGPERDRRAAEALAVKLKGAGQKGSIVAHP